MGNACTTTQKKTITIPSRVMAPSRVIRVREKLPTEKSLKTTNNTGGSTPTSTFKSDAHTLNAKRKSAKVEVQTFGEADEEAKTSATLRPLPLKYDLSDLGIGEHYLENELLDVIEKCSEQKKKKLAKNNVKWDRAVVQNRLKVSQTSQLDELYNFTDLCLQEFTASNPKLYKKMLKLGVPSRYRWSVWKNHAEIDKFFTKDLYERLKGLSTKWENDIRKDLHRTFPTEPYFSAAKFEKIGQEHLYNVLKAISLYFPNIGYAQSMNFLVAFLLLVNGGNELEAFWMFVTLARDPKYLMMGFFEQGFPLLEFYTFVFYEIMKTELPALYDHIKIQQIPDLLWLFKWFLTIFLYSFPSKYGLRIWDFVMVNGLTAMIQVAFGIVKFLEKDMLCLDTFGIDQLFKHLKGEAPKPKTQSVHEVALTPNVHSGVGLEMQKKGTVIVNHVASQGDDGHNNNSIQQGMSEMSEANYNYKEFDIEEILDIAEKVHLSPEKMAQFAALYEEQSEKKLPGLYQNFYNEMPKMWSDTGKILDFESDVDYHLMKSELFTKIVPAEPLKVEKQYTEVMVTLLEEGDDISVLKITNI